jgi:broad specificity phosphatase PhoE
MRTYPSMRTTELLLVRHGQSEGNVGCSTDPDCALTQLGLEQARAAARRLAGFDLSGFAGITSPYRRAVQTAREIRAATGLAFAEDDDVREWGPAATVGGKTFEHEPVERTVERLKSFLRRVAGRRLLVVSHAAPIALLTNLAWGEPPRTEGEFWLGVGNCCPRWVRTTTV